GDVTREDILHRGVVQALEADFGQDVAVVSGHGQVAGADQLPFVQAGPRAVDFAAQHVPAQDHHHAAVTVVGAQAAVLGGAAPKLGHGHDRDVVEVIGH